MNFVLFSSIATIDDKDLEKIRRRVATLDKYYIPTRYPNGLPGGIPSEAFEKRDADRAIEIAGEVIKVIEGKLLNYGHMC